MRRLGLALYAAALAIAFGLFLIGAAHAQEPMIGKGTVCDTQEQATRYVEVLMGNETAYAIAKVNEEVGDDDACVDWMVAFLPVEEVAQVSNEYGRYQIVRIVVMGSQTPMGMQASPPKFYFAVARLPGHEI